MLIFKNRKDAGIKLCELLTNYSSEDLVILALPRGGIVVAHEVAKFLSAPLSLIITQKIGHPFASEYAIGAISSEGTVLLNEEETSSVDKGWLEIEKIRKMREAQRRQALYIPKNHQIRITNKTVILIDDGLATGLTMRLAVMMVKKQKPKQIIVAVPVASKEAIKKLERDVDKIISLEIPSYLGSIGEYYENFSQITDDEVIAIMKEY